MLFLYLLLTINNEQPNNLRLLSKIKMKDIITPILFILLATSQSIFAQEGLAAHPDVTSEGWRPLFANDLSNSIAEPGVWSIEKGVITATKDEAYGLIRHTKILSSTWNLKMQTAQTAA